MNYVFRFENAAVFNFFWLLPFLLVFIIFFTRQHRKKMNKYFGEKLLPFLTSSTSHVRRRLKISLEIIAIIFFVLALARPQSGKSEQKVKSEGVELIFLFDVSKSMLTEDVKPSRLEFAKKELMRFLDFGGGDRVGLLAFAGSGILLSPMTEDKSALKMYIESLSPDTVSTQGTEFRQALTSAREAFKRGGVEEDEKTVVTRAVIIVSDGEDNEPGALEMAKSLREEGVYIFTLAVGTEKGGAIPIRDDRGNLRGYRKDQSGKVVLSRTKGTVLQELAKIGGGSFHHVTYGGDAMRILRKDIEKLEKSQFESAVVTKYDEKFQIFLLFGVLIALIEILLGERRAGGRIWRGRFEVIEQ